MADAGTCCMRSGWDLSFLESEAVRLQNRHFSCRSDFSRQPPMTIASLRTPISPTISTNPLAFVVRRRSSNPASPSNQLPQQPTTLGANSATCRSPGTSLPLTNSADGSSDHAYENHSSDHTYENQAATSGDEVMWSISLRGIACRATSSSASSSSGSSSSSSDDDLLTTPPSGEHQLHTSTGCRFLQTPAAAATVRRCSLSPVSQTTPVFPPEDGARSVVSRAKRKSDNVYARVTRCLSSWNDDRLAATFHRLSLCHFYFGKLSFDEAKVLLRRHPAGTFLLRDSSDKRFPFALSVQTRRGTTSIRIVCEYEGRFRLDCEPEQVHLMPTFDCVVALVQFYARHGERRSAPNNLVLLEMSGRNDMPVLLRRPYETSPPKLAHLCRKRINGSLGRNSVNRLQLLPSLKDFLNDYPYDI